MPSTYKRNCNRFKEYHRQTNLKNSYKVLSSFSSAMMRDLSHNDLSALHYQFKGYMRVHNIPKNSTPDRIFSQAIRKLHRGVKKEIVVNEFRASVAKRI